MSDIGAWLLILAIAGVATYGIAKLIFKPRDL